MDKQIADNSPRRPHTSRPPSPLQRFRQAIRVSRHLLDVKIGRDIRFPVDVQTEMIHIGTIYGGRVICPKLITRDSMVYSFGVGDDISFDQEMIDRFGVTIHAFDPTPFAIKWLKTQSVSSKFVLHEIGLGDHDGVAEFLPPPQDDVSFQITETGKHQGPRDGAVQLPIARMTTIMRDLGHDHIDVLKVDIEGAEYAALEDIVASGIPVAQLLVEFHHRVGDKPSHQKTISTVNRLQGAGYRIFHVSPTGIDYAFLGPSVRS